MADQAKAMLNQSAPWRRGVAWPIILVEGVVVLAIGIYVLADTDDARDVVRQLLGAVLLLNGVLSILAGFRLPQAPAAPYLLVRGAVAVTVGLLVTLDPITDDLDASSSRFILAVGGLAYGLLGLVLVAVTRGETGLRIGPLITSGFWIALGIVFIIGDETDDTRLNVLGIIAIVFGLLLVAYAYYLYRLKQADAAAPTDQPAVGPAG